MPDKITKFINSLDKRTRKRLKQKLLDLKKDPINFNGVKKLQNWGKSTYRIRVGKIRIIYRLNQKDITIIDIDYRGNIY